jgi:hypothetical protein
MIGQRIETILSWVIIAVTAAFLFAASGGCQTSVTNRYAVAQGQLTGGIATARQNVQAAMPHVNASGIGFLQVADKSLANAQEQIPIIAAGLTAGASASRDLEIERTKFFSYRQRHDAFWIILTVIVGVLVIVTLRVVATVATGPVASIAAVGFHAATLGVGLIYNGAVAAADKLKSTAGDALTKPVITLREPGSVGSPIVQ